MDEVVDEGQHENGFSSIYVRSETPCEDGHTTTRTTAKWQEKKPEDKIQKHMTSVTPMWREHRNRVWSRNKKQEIKALPRRVEKM